MTYSALTHLECSRTAERYDADQVQGTSAAGAPLLARYDLERVRETAGGRCNDGASMRDGARKPRRGRISVIT